MASTAERHGLPTDQRRPLLLTVVRLLAPRRKHLRKHSCNYIAHEQLACLRQDVGLLDVASVFDLSSFTTLLSNPACAFVYCYKLHSMLHVQRES